MIYSAQGKLSSLLCYTFSLKSNVHLVPDSPITKGFPLRRPPSYPCTAKSVPSLIPVPPSRHPPSNQHFLGVCSVQLQGTVVQRGLNPILTPDSHALESSLRFLICEMGRVMVGLGTTGCTPGHWQRLEGYDTMVKQPRKVRPQDFCHMSLYNLYLCPFCTFLLWIKLLFCLFVCVSVVLDSRMSHFNLLLQGDPSIELSLQITMRQKAGAFYHLKLSENFQPNIQMSHSPKSSDQKE